MYVRVTAIDQILEMLWSSKLIIFIKIIASQKKKPTAEILAKIIEFLIMQDGFLYVMIYDI